ncbi:MAG: YceI family protein [Pseudomonadota bacterium]
MKTLILALAAVSSFALTAQASPKEFTLDLGHAYIGWQTDHLGLSSTIGQFKDFNGQFVIDETAPEASSIAFTVKTASIDSNHLGRDNHLRNSDFLDTENFPEMTFESSEIVMSSKTEGVVTGDLTLRGVTAPLSLDFKMVGDRSFPGFLPNYDELRAIGFEATGTLDRTDHGIDTVSFPGSPVPDEIKLDIHFDLVDCSSAPATNVPCNWGHVDGFKGPNE